MTWVVFIFYFFLIEFFFNRVSYFFLIYFLHSYHMLMDLVFFSRFQPLTSDLLEMKLCIFLYEIILVS